MHRRFSCPGSARMEAQCGEEPESEEATEGRLLHVAFAGESVALNEEQERLIRVATESMGEMRAYAADLTQGVETAEVFREETMRWGALEGTPDRLEVWDGDLAIISDLKCGRLAVEKADDNLQLASYAVLAKNFRGIKRALVGILQPRLGAKARLTMAHYDVEGLQRAEDEVLRIMAACEAPDAPLHASERACRYCRAKLKCPEWGKQVQPLAVVPQKQAIATLDAPSLVCYFLACKAAASIREQVNDEMRWRIEAGELPGWEMKPGAEMKKVRDIIGAYTALREHFGEEFDASKFTDCTDLSLPKLALYVRDLTAFSEYRTKKLVEDILAPLIERKAKRPSPTQIVMPAYDVDGNRLTVQT